MRISDEDARRNIMSEETRKNARGNVCTFHDLAADLRDARAALRAHVKDAFAALTDEERKEIMRGYCRECCTDDPRCQCWNDE